MAIGRILPILAVVAAAAVVASGFGARFGVWRFGVGFEMLRLGVYASFAIAALALISLLVPKMRANRVASLAMALTIGLVAGAVPAYWFEKGISVPPINDITTDTANPPAFAAIIPLRASAPVPSAYPGEAFAKQQQRRLSRHQASGSGGMAPHRIRESARYGEADGLGHRRGRSCPGSDRSDGDDALVRLQGRRRDPHHARAWRQPTRHSLGFANRQERPGRQCGADPGLCCVAEQRLGVIRDNPVKARSPPAARAFGAMVFEFFSPGLPQICRNAGAEFVLFDMEHTGLGFETLKMQFALCRGLGIVPMVRVPRGEYHFIARALDVGAHGRDGADGRNGRGGRGTSCPARAIRPPDGAAPRSASRTTTTRAGDVASKIAAMHARTMVIAQIETAEGLANVEAIAAVPGVDALWLGHFDLTQLHGHSRPASASRVSRRRRRASSPPATPTARRPAFLATDDDWARDYAAKGFRLLAYGIDQLMLQGALAHGLDVLRGARNGRPKHAMTGQIPRRHHPRHPRFARRARFGRSALAILDDAAGSRLGIPAGGRARDHADHAARYDALYVNTPRVPAAAVARADCRLRVVARHGVGYDSVDVAAMTRAGVVVTNTPIVDAAPGGDDRADVHAGARRQAVAARTGSRAPAAGTSGWTTWAWASPGARWASSAPAASARNCCGWRARSTSSCSRPTPTSTRSNSRYLGARKVGLDTLLARSPISSSSAAS